jgi:DNA-binding response OmpR family regulator
MMPALQRPHILIVSDDPDLTGFLGEGLVYAGFWTSVIASAVQTLEVFRLRTFDLMIVDAELGGIGATELIRRLRGRSDRSAPTGRTDIPIVVLTSEPDLDPAPLLAAGGDTVLAAPIELEDLARELAELVQHWRAAHPERPWADELAQSSA